ncbi:hypothetical protein M8J75_007579 [Diaphorina citri]|nr:hypothetical protein M8J75_007579 [Diaphorina citri]
METDETQDTVGKYRTPLEYYNSQEYRTWYDNYCKSVTVQYRKTPVAYDPTSEEAKNVNPALRTEEYEIANAWPPCLRIMVTETSVKGLQPGTLFLVTYLGGTIGREGEHAVLIPDINISKHHAKIEFTGTESHKDDPSKGYTLVDLGSRNGTYVDNVRLSSALQESEPHLLKHGTELRIGSTKLSVHIHNGRDTCDQCEPGVGSLVEGEKTQVAHMEESIPNENKGFRMLSKMGWKAGQTLGKDEANSAALIEPIIPQQYAKNAGLGSSMPGPVPTSSNPKEERKKSVWEKTRARYKVLGDEPPPPASSSPEFED